MSNINDNLTYEDPEDGIEATTASTSTNAGAGKTNSTFDDYFLKPELMKAISSFGFEHPSVVQQQCIPQAIIGSDVICQALSGMGKTAVFVLSVLQQLDMEKAEGKTVCLVLCHNRELANQIKNEFVRFSSNFEKQPTVEAFTGGVPAGIHKSILKKKSPTIVVGTPGRLAHLVDDGSLKLGDVKHFVIDECDAVLKKDERSVGTDRDPFEMRRHAQKLYMTCPRSKQVLMFTATLDTATKDLCKKFMSDPIEVLVESDVSLNLVNLKQYYVRLTEEEKVKKLISILDDFQFNQVIIFVQKPQHVTMLNKILARERFPSINVHGNMPQRVRVKNCERFKKYEARVMVATAALARGVDFEAVNVVVNFDVPANTDMYLHKVARAGRFGTKGLAITFVTSKEESDLINDAQKRFNVSIEELPATIDSSEYTEEKAEDAVKSE